MSQNSSVAVLADCTDLYNNHVSLMGLNGPSSVVNIENETILTSNTDVSIGQVIGSVSFLERVQSTDLAALYSKGSPNQKSNESLLSTSQSSENLSSLKSNINVTEPDENASAFPEGCSESKKMENKDEFTKPFNKCLHLKKKSVNISLDSSSVSDSITKKSLEKNVIESAGIFSNELLVIQNRNDISNECSDGNLYASKIAISNSSESVNVTIIGEEKNKSAPENDELSNILTSDSLKSNINVTEPDENILTSFKGSFGNKKMKSEEESTKSFSKDLCLEKKSVNISLSDPITEKRFEGSVTESVKNGSKELIVIQNSNDTSNDRSDGNVYASKIAISNYSEVDISIIPISNPVTVSNKPVTRSRAKYHSTPISRTLSKKNRRKIKLSSNIKMEDENIQQDDKMIQVSKSIFGSSNETTNATVSKKKSIEISNNSSQCHEKSDSRAKRKSDSYQTEIKKLAKMESNCETHSNFITTLQDESSFCITRKSMKRVAFKSISSYENSTSDYRNSSVDCTFRKRKSVRLRHAISLVEDTVCNSFDGYIRDANNSDLSTVDPNSIGINETPDTVSVSRSRIDRTHHSFNYSAEAPEIILTENAIECNETSKDCSLFTKLLEMAENKKSGRNMATRQTKLSRGRKKLGSSNLVKSRAMPDLTHHEKWVSPNLIKFLNNKLMTDALDHIINTERIVSILCSTVSAVRNLQDTDDIDFALLPLKNILLKFRICCNMIEYCTFISRFTPFKFQHKTLPLGGYFGSIKRDIRKKLTDPILTETEKMNVFL